jgi:hypothetical protein
VIGAVAGILAIRATALRGEALFVWGVLAALVGAIVGSVLNVLMFPPDVVVTDDYRQILHPPMDEQSHTSGFDGPGSDHEVGNPTEVADSRLSLAGLPSRRSLEGVVIGVVAVVMAMFFAYSAVEPAILKVWPGFLGARNGPAGFPVQIAIGNEALLITNGSADRWDCSVSLGDAREFSMQLRVVPGVRAVARYERFAGSDALAESDAYSKWMAARRALTIACTEPSGRVHWKTW